VNVGCARQVGRLVRDVPGEQLRVVSTREATAKGGGLDHPFVCKLLVGRRNNAQSRGGLVAS
jgi:hypothetical protein